MSQLSLDLAVKLPSHYRNYEGKLQEANRPKGNILARCGDVILIQQTKDEYAVAYCLDVITRMDRDRATACFGQSCIHQAECNGLTR